MVSVYTNVYMYVSRCVHVFQCVSKSLSFEFCDVKAHGGIGPEKSVAIAGSFASNPFDNKCNTCHYHATCVLLAFHMRKTHRTRIWHFQAFTLRPVIRLLGAACCHALLMAWRMTKMRCQAANTRSTKNWQQVTRRQFLGFCSKSARNMYKYTLGICVSGFWLRLFSCLQTTRPGPSLHDRYCLQFIENSRLDPLCSSALRNATEGFGFARPFHLKAPVTPGGDGSRPCHWTQWIPHQRQNPTDKKDPHICFPQSIQNDISRQQLRLCSLGARTHSASFGSPGCEAP